MPYPIIGNVPRGEDYFGQERLIESLWNRLEKDNILLTAPRRFGKTAAMYKLLDEPRPQFLPVYTDLEPIETAGDFMVELISKIYQKRQFKRIINRLWEGSKDMALFFRNLPEDMTFSAGSSSCGGRPITVFRENDIDKKSTPVQAPTHIS